MWTGQTAIARELAEWVLERIEYGLFKAWAYRLLGIAHVKEGGGACSLGAADGPGTALAQAEAAFRQAIAVARQAEVWIQEALAASELKRMVLDPSGRGEEGDALVAAACSGVRGTEEELACFLARASWA